MAVITALIEERTIHFIQVKVCVEIFLLFNRMEKAVLRNAAHQSPSDILRTLSSLHEK
jgi:hypothetical protein